MNKSDPEEGWESYWENHKTIDGRHWQDAVRFNAGMWSHKHPFYFETATGKIPSKKEEFAVFISRFGENFWSSA